MVKYEKGGYYGKECKCSTCTGSSTRILKRPARDEHVPQDLPVQRVKRRKGHRGGKPARAKKLKDTEIGQLSTTAH